MDYLGPYAVRDYFGMAMIRFKDSLPELPISGSLILLAIGQARSIKPVEAGTESKTGSFIQNFSRKKKSTHFFNNSKQSIQK